MTDKEREAIEIKDSLEILENTDISNIEVAENICLRTYGYAVKTVLNLVQKQQKEINALNQVHRYDEKTIDEVKGEAVKLYKIIDEMAKFIEEQTGSCPLDMFNYKEIDCENVCKQEMYPCWIEYFKRKVEDK